MKGREERKVTFWMEGKMSGEPAVFGMPGIGRKRPEHVAGKELSVMVRLRDY